MNLLGSETSENCNFSNEEVCNGIVTNTTNFFFTSLIFL